MGPAYYILLDLIKILELNKYDYTELAVSCWTVLTILFVLPKSHKITIYLQDCEVYTISTWGFNYTKLL